MSSLTSLLICPYSFVYLTYFVHVKSTGELIIFDSAIAQSEVWSQRNAPRIAESKRKKNDFTFWLIFGLSPNSGLSDCDDNDADDENDLLL